MGMKGSSVKLWEPLGAIWDGWAGLGVGGEFETVVGAGNGLNCLAGRGGLNVRDRRWLLTNSSSCSCCRVGDRVF